MGNMEVRATIKRRSNGLFGVEVSVVRIVNGEPRVETTEEQQSFFSQREAKEYARHRLGIPERQIRADI